MKYFLLVLYFIIGLFFGGYSVLLNAATIPAPKTPVNIYWVDAIPASKALTYAESCRIAGTIIGKATYTGTYACLHGYGSEVVIVGWQTGATCDYGFNSTTRTCNPVPPDTCEDGSSPANGSCDTCRAGDFGTVSRYVGTFSAGQKDVTYGQSTPITGPLCDGSCFISVTAVVSCTSTSVARGTPIKCNYEGKKTGASCTVRADSTVPQGDPCYGEGKVSGTVNGVPVCGGEAPKTTENGETVKTPGTTSDTKKVTTCVGDSCTTTTTETTTSGGSGEGGTGDGSSTVVKETETTTDKPTFCSENPTSPQCSEPSACETDPTLLECMQSGSPPEEGALNSVEKSVITSIIPVQLGGGGSCPADIELPNGAYMTYSSVCQYAEGIKPFVLLSAWLAAGVFVLAMGKP